MKFTVVKKYLKSLVVRLKKKMSTKIQKDSVNIILKLFNRTMIVQIKKLENVPEKNEKGFFLTTGIWKRKNNGHKINKKRSLTDEEKDLIRSQFMTLNGQIEEDACKSIHKKINSNVSIFQITGFVTYLHREIARGLLQVNDMEAYEKFLQSHRNQWAKYDSPKYHAMGIKQ